MNRDTWTKAKKIVADRDKCCLRCFAEIQVVHHRRVRGLGGSSDPEINTGLANLVGLCDQCHREVHASPEESYETGFLVRMGMSPENIPLLVTPDFTVFLDNDGKSEGFLQGTLF